MAPASTCKNRCRTQMTRSTAGVALAGVDFAGMAWPCIACAAVASELKPQLRTLLHYHCGVKTLRTRQMMIDIQSL